MTTLREAIPDGTLKFLETGFVRREVWDDHTSVSWFQSDRTRLYDDDVLYAIVPGASHSGYDPDLVNEANFKWVEDNFGDILDPVVHRFEWSNSTQWCADLDGPACGADHEDEDCTCLADIFDLDYPLIDDSLYSEMEQEVINEGAEYMVADLRRDIAHLYPDSTMLDDVDDEQLGTLYWDAQNELGLYPEVEGMGIYFPKREWKDIINFVVDNLRK